MATVNIANNTWQTNLETSTINITANSTMIYFNMGTKLTNEMACAKACIEIDISQYKTITLKLQVNCNFYASYYKETFFFVNIQNI